MSKSPINQRLWDLPVRLTHFALIVLVLLQWGTAEWGWLDMEWHYYFGYAILTLVLFRIIWGFVGSETARFAHFMRGPSTILAYIKSGGKSSGLGHNPIGALSVLAFLGLLLVQALTGMFSEDDYGWSAPLAGLVSSSMSHDLMDIHEDLKDYLLIVIGLHIAAAFFYLLVKKDNLISPMISGDKPVVKTQQLKFESGWRAFWILLACAGLVTAVVRFA